MTRDITSISQPKSQPVPSPPARTSTVGKNAVSEVDDVFRSAKRHQPADFTMITVPVKKRTALGNETLVETLALNKLETLQAPTTNQVASVSESEKRAWACVFDSDGAAPKIYSGQPDSGSSDSEDEPRSSSLDLIERLSSIPDEQYVIRPLTDQKPSCVKRLKRSYGEHRSYLLATSSENREEELTNQQEFTTSIQDMKAIGHQNALREEVEYLLEDLEHLDEVELKHLAEQLAKNVNLHREVPPARIEKSLGHVLPNEVLKYTQMALIVYYLKIQEMCHIIISLGTIDKTVLAQHNVAEQKLKHVLGMSDT